MRDSTVSAYTGRQIYRRLLSFVKPYWKVFVCSIAAMVVIAMTEPAFAALMKPLLDGGFVDKDPMVIKWIPVALIGIFVLRGIFSFVSTYGMAWVARKVIMDLRQTMFRHLLYLPVRFYHNTPSGRLISKFSYDVEQVAQASSTAITVIVRDSFSIIGLLAWMFYLNWLLASVFIILGPIVAILLFYINNRLRRLSTRIQNSMGDVTHSVDQVIKCQDVVKTYGGQQLEINRFTGINDKNRRFHMKLTATTAANVPIMQLLAACALAAIIFIATMGPVLEEVTVGVFMSFMTAMLLLMPPIKHLTTVNVVLQRGIAAAESIFHLLDSELERDRGTYECKRVKGLLEFLDVSFTYDKTKGSVLNSIGFRVEPGQTVAIVGPNGSGKSTLIYLISRMYEVEQGKIYLDGVGIDEYSLESLRDQIAYVGQNIVLFNDTVRNNIAYGRKNVTTEDIIKAAKAAHAMEYIERLPKGIEEEIGENGVNLSGGQRQRLAIARALLKNAPLLILDEATSSLDGESTRWVQAGLNKLMQQRTTVVIAHQLATIENADQIILMDSGWISDIGKHEELLARSRLYASLYRHQFAASA